MTLSLKVTADFHIITTSCKYDAPRWQAQEILGHAACDVKYVQVNILSASKVWGEGGGGEKNVLPFCVTGYFAPKFRDQKQPNQEPKPKGQVSLVSWH